MKSTLLFIAFWIVLFSSQSLLGKLPRAKVIELLNAVDLVSYQTAMTAELWKAMPSPETYSMPEDEFNDKVQAILKKHAARITKNPRYVDRMVDLLSDKFTPDEFDELLKLTEDRTARKYLSVMPALTVESNLLVKELGEDYFEMVGYEIMALRQKYILAECY